MKTKLAVFAGAAGVAVLITIGSIMAAQAATSTLATTCTGAVSGNQVTWSATSTGGNAPFAFLWSGDASVAGATSTNFVKSYTTNGTYIAGIQATDASSSVATSTCTAVVSAILPPATTSTLNVILSVNNAQGGSAIPANFTVAVSGANANPTSFAGSSSGTAVTVNGGTTYSVGASSVANYSMSQSGNCAGPITTGAADACTVTETFVPPTTTPTSTLPRVNPPTLSIGPNGIFLARGMTVTSVASGSFQGQIWGITYTVNWSGNVLPEFFFRSGNGPTSTVNPSQQVNVGDEVGVLGRVTPTSPLVVTANVVRDYSITTLRPGHKSFFGDVGDNGIGNAFGLLQGFFAGHGNDKGNNKGNGNGKGDR